MPPACGSHPEYLFRLAPLDVFRRKKTREVVTDYLFATVTFDPFGADIPANNRPLRVQQEDRIVLDFVEEHLIFFLAVPERLPSELTSRAAALDAPAGRSRDHKAEDGPDNQNSFGLAEAPFRVGIAQNPQSQLFAPHLANYRLKLIHDLLARFTSSSLRCHLQALGPPQINDCLGGLDYLRRQPFESRNPPLLFGVIRCQI